MAKRLKNTSTVPVPLHDGRMVAPGEFAEVDKVTGITKDAVAAGQLTEEAQPTKAGEAALERAAKQQEEGQPNG